MFNISFQTLGLSCPNCEANNIVHVNFFLHTGLQKPRVSIVSAAGTKDLSDFEGQKLEFKKIQ